MVEDQNLFLNQIEELKSYMVEFDEDNAIKAKEYSIYCIIENDEYQLIIVITHDKYDFSTNDRVRKA